MRGAAGAWIGCLAALSGVAGTADAAPSRPPPPCAFTLSTAAEGDMLTATVVSAECAPAAVPYSSVACLQAGDGAPQTCASGSGTNLARVAVPYQPGLDYTATGRGCAGWVGLPPAPDCQLLGPMAATP